MIKRCPNATDLPLGRIARDRYGQSRVIERNLLPGIAVEPFNDPLHLRMSARAGCEVFELAREIAGVKASKARCKVAIALAFDTVASGAGHSGTGLSAAESYELSRRCKWIGSGVGGAGRQPNGCGADKEYSAKRHAVVQSAAGRRGSRRYRMGAAIMLTAALMGCKPPSEARYVPDPQAVARGRALAAAAGCTACHTFPDIAWPQGRAGPSLIAFDGTGPIAGALPNTPDNLAAFVRNAPTAKPGSTMPAMPLSPSEARDIAAYLYGVAND